MWKMSDVAQNFEPFIRTLRDARPDTPIVLVGAGHAHAGQRIVIDRRTILSRLAANKFDVSNTFFSGAKESTVKVTFG